jgi:hypothetical protein
VQNRPESEQNAVELQRCYAVQGLKNRLACWQIKMLRRGLPDEDAVPEIQETLISAPADFWLLGNQIPKMPLAR